MEHLQNLSNLARKAKSLFATGLVLASSYLPNAKADVQLRTNPPPVMIADGQTVYKIDVIADTIEESGKLFRSISYDLGIPAGVDYIEAKLPGASMLCYDTSNPSTEPSDFFQGLVMEEPGSPPNTVCNAPIPNGTNWPWKVPANNRRTLNPFEGSADREGVIGSYFVKVNEAAVPGEKRFTTSAAMAYNTTDSCSYNALGCLPGNSCTTGSNTGCLVQVHPFSKVVEPGDMNLDFAVNDADTEGFIDALINPDAYWAARLAHQNGSADMNLDGLVDASDIQPFVNKVLGQ